MYTYNPDKTGVDTRQLITNITSTLKFWTEFVHKEYFKRNSKVKPIHIFEFMLRMAEYRSQSAKSILNKMYMEHEQKYNVDISKIRVVSSTMNEARDKIDINIWQLIFDDMEYSIYACLYNHNLRSVDIL